jgi:hypothetical protein
VLWLGGLDPLILSYLQPGSELVIEPPASEGIPGEGPAPVKLPIRVPNGSEGHGPSPGPKGFPTNPIPTSLRKGSPVARALDLVVANRTTDYNGLNGWMPPAPWRRFPL